jgi:hypothetical protein
MFSYENIFVSLILWILFIFKPSLNMKDNREEQPTSITLYVGNTDSVINDAEKGKNSSITQSSPIESPVEVST